MSLPVQASPVQTRPDKPPPEATAEELRSWETRIGGSAASAVPDFIEAWGRKPFWRLGGAGAVAAAASAAALGPTDHVTLGIAVPLAAYLALGVRDMSQNRHTVLRNFPVLGNIRYILETIRPEIRQYFVESDREAAPFSRLERNIVYQRSKGVPDTLPFGTRSDVYETGYEWLTHSSLSPCHVDPAAARVVIGGPDCGHPYSASLFNVSGMSYGALSDNAILALNGAAKLGAFYHNTGEGGISRFHLQPGGDIVWNIGTGYFGCRDKSGGFSAERFVESVSPPQALAPPEPPPHRLGGEQQARERGPPQAARRKNAPPGEDD